MPRVLFWNVQRKQLDSLVMALIADQTPDIVVLVETPPRSRLSAFLAPTGWQRVGRSERFTVLTRQTFRFTRLLNPDPTDRIEFWHVAPPAADDWLFALVHGPDRRNATDDTRRLLFDRFRAAIRELENLLGHRRTVILGDLNANPHDPSVLCANGLHAIGVRRVRGRTDRAIRNAGRADFFYNPMWRLYGSDPAGDSGAGSYYYHEGYDATELFWHMLDQVLIRPEYADRLPANMLRLVTSAGSTDLTTTDGHPDPAVGSDHLPVAFEEVPRADTRSVAGLQVRPEAARRPPNTGRSGTRVEREDERPGRISRLARRGTGQRVPRSLSV
ncbi:endonuclease/exonuclease/phosphatase family protein [Frigoriglobus tundricola]|uniref:Endonuclease/exonuclease/phosphatase domain-containing protein n=1 Tax=Frigoriglobus tundricola TaxID=2774151 RepID=A0A6M5YXG4_9BACT|nr:endonuclease/exonuclease/phosphatase family protein [Frigoriglobus tundricola]QJW97893.1 hypothetical protein FTUN_5473 [Frigoriglobus tundricola]